MNLMKYEAVASQLTVPPVGAEHSTALATRDTLGVTVLRRIPRSYRCYHLPKHLLVSQLHVHSEALAAGMARCLSVASLVARQEELSPGVWVCSYWHGDKRKHRLSTYDDTKGPGAIWYRPRLAATLVFDSTHHLLMVSLPKSVLPGSVLGALECLFETALPERLDDLMWDLPKLLSLSPEMCRPLAPEAPWRALQLKSMAWHEAGASEQETMARWTRDGWEDYRLSAIARTPSRVHSVTVRICTEGRKGYALQFGPEDEVVKLSICEAILPALRTLLSWMTVSSPASVASR